MYIIEERSSINIDFPLFCETFIMDFEKYLYQNLRKTVAWVRGYLTKRVPFFIALAI